MILQAQCDGCRVTGQGNEIHTTYGGRHLCNKCLNIEELNDLIKRLESKKRWLETIHLKEIKEMEDEIIRLRKVIE